jgi:hypothetical protein
VNVLWALLNLAVGYMLFRAGRVCSGSETALVVFFAGIVAMSVMLSTGFQGKHAN